MTLGRRVVRGPPVKDFWQRGLIHVGAVGRRWCGRFNVHRYCRIWLGFRLRRKLHNWVARRSAVGRSEQGRDLPMAPPTSVPALAASCSASVWEIASIYHLALNRETARALLGPVRPLRRLEAKTTRLAILSAGVFGDDLSGVGAVIVRLVTLCNRSHGLAIVLEMVEHRFSTTDAATSSQHQNGCDPLLARSVRFPIHDFFHRVELSGAVRRTNVRCGLG